MKSVNEEMKGMGMKGKQTNKGQRFKEREESKKKQNCQNISSKRSDHSEACVNAN